ncbi:YjdF family protein [Nonomuraea rhodomycinica]|uniref:YjdF family protein n=1 Tax=Nonomuraea rhodomycinica TaxID=1712872 RepID=A0A7Y6IXE6_9ACTN|nr:YjdF family protein [Nonomuraea rhodomycinica]NUW45831.1 YjdF family protein [Nonomuraea rhodomycinica]
MVTFSVYLDGSFWVGVLEVTEDGVLRVTRHTFGSEPTDPELYAFLLRHGVALLERASAAPAVPAGERAARRVNPKRAAKLAARAAARVSSRGTAAQEAMRLELESRKREAAEGRRERRRELAEHKREVARRKRAERRRDR